MAAVAIMNDHGTGSWRRVVAVLLLFAAPWLPCHADDWWPSRTEKFRVSFTSHLEPIVINRIHSWVLHVETGDGTPVPDARISVNGGMPQHDHGLPTAPEVTRELGDGDYLVEGLRFHMNGYWELELTIAAAGTTDTVVIPLTL